MLTWSAPWWLAALGVAVAAPLVAHLLSRRGGVLAAFPTVRFIERAVADVARLQRPRHWLLMLLRIAALALVALAFADPRWLTAAPVAGDGTLRVGFIIDNSASMQRAGGGVTLFDRARAGAIDALRSLDPARDKALVILADARPHALLAEPSANFTQLVAQLDAAEPTQQRGDLERAIDLAATTLRSAGDGAIRLEVFTDAQRTIDPAPAAERWRAQGIAVNVHILGRAQPNVAVQDVRLVPAQPVAGQPALLHARVRNFADAARTVTVSCGEQRQRLHLQPYREADAVFEVRFDAPGPATVGVTLDAGDVLPADDTAGLAVDVADARPVAIVTRADTMDSAAAAYFTFRGLSPSPDGREEGVALRVVHPDQLAAQDAQPGGVWVLVEAGAIGAAARDALARHVEAGGGALWIIDSPDAAASVAAWDISPIARPMWVAGASATLAVGRFDSPVLAVFEGPGRSTLLDHAFARYAAGTLAPQADGLLLASDGAPLLAAAWHGRGRAALLAADLSPASTGFTKSPVWPALLHQLVRHLAPGGAPPAPLRPGDVLPDGSIARTTGPIDTPAGAAWVELHPDESDLRAVNVGEAVERAKPPLGRELGAERQAAGVTLRPREHELWPWLMLGALALLACETIVTWMIDPRGKPSRSRGWDDPPAGAGGLSPGVNRV